MTTKQGAFGVDASIAPATSATTLVSPSPRPVAAGQIFYQTNVHADVELQSCPG